MCLRDQKRTETLTDGAGYKVVLRIGPGRYRSIFAGTSLSSRDRDWWYQAVPEVRVVESTPLDEDDDEPPSKGIYILYEYGFHAYRRLEDAREAATEARNLHYNVDTDEIVVVLVLLSDIFGTGQDNSFGQLKADCVVARAMRIVQEQP